MKVLFLDHDGVICLSREWGSRFQKKKRFLLEGGDENNLPPNIRFDNFNKMAVDVLNEIIITSGTEIVCSSDWRLYATLEEMRDLFYQYGVIKGPIDFTPELQTITKKANIRVEEIKLWLNNHPEVTNWVAIDDMDLSELDNFVKTREREGLKQCNISSKILKFLQ